MVVGSSLYTGNVSLVANVLVVLILAVCDMKLQLLIWILFLIVYFIFLVIFIWFVCSKHLIE